MDPRAYRIAQEFVRAHVRRARWAPEFLQVVDPQKFRNPETGNEVRFVSLPEEEQTRIYEAWRSKNNVREEAPKQKKPETSGEVARANQDIARNGRIVSRRTLSEGGSSEFGEPEKAGVNQSEIVRLEHDGQSQIFIRKPADGETPHLRMGIPAGTYHQREQSAYGLDTLIGGQGIVPVTATRGEDDGSYQLWSRGARPMNGTDLDELSEKFEPEKLLESPDFHRLNVLDLILGHEDRHNGNILWSLDGDDPKDLRMVAIDNGLSLGSPQSFPGMQTYAHPFSQFFPNDENLDEIDAKAQQTDYRERGDKTVEKALSDIDPKLHAQLKQVDLKDAAKALTASGLNDQKAVRAALVRLAALQADPKVFAQMSGRQETLNAAWQDFQFSSGQNDNLLYMAGAGDREKDIDRALEAAKPRGGWAPSEEAEKHVKDMRNMLKDMDGWGDTGKPDDKTAPTQLQPQEDEDNDWSKMASNVTELWLKSKIARRRGKLTISTIDPRTFRKKVVGVFELDRDGNVKDQYKDNRFKYEIRRGIQLMGKRIKPEDGARFMAALEKTYGARTLFDVKRT